MLSDDAISRFVLEAQAGDRLAFARVADALRPLLYRCVRRCGVRDSDCEDVCIEALYAAWQRIGSLSDPARFRPWVVRIARRTAGRARRRRLPETVGEWTEEHEAGVRRLTPRPEEHAAALSTAEVFQGLDAEERALAEQKYVQRWTNAEIGRTLGWTLDQVVGRVRKVREKLCLRLRQIAPDQCAPDSLAGNV